MVKKIEFLFPDFGVNVDAELLEREAPKTCEALWKLLEHPIETEAEHAHWCGAELAVSLPLEKLSLKLKEDLKNIHEENQTCFPIPGEIQYCYKTTSLVDEIEEYCCLAVWYGRGQLFYKQGWWPLNVFAIITDYYYYNRKELYNVGRRIFREGVKKVIVRRKNKPKTSTRRTV